MTLQKLQYLTARFVRGIKATRTEHSEAALLRPPFEGGRGVIKGGCAYTSAAAPCAQVLRAGTLLGMVSGISAKRPVRDGNRGLRLCVVATAFPARRVWFRAPEHRDRPRLGRELASGR